MAKKIKYSKLVRKGEFHDHGVVMPDAKRRVAIPGPVNQLYRYYRNAAGQILLDPQVTIPANEAWLYKDEEALKTQIKRARDEYRATGGVPFKKK